MYLLQIHEYMSKSLAICDDMKVNIKNFNKAEKYLMVKTVDN